MRKVLVLIGLAFVSFAGIARAQEEAAEAPAATEPAADPAGDPAMAEPAAAEPAAAMAAPAGYPDEYALRPLNVSAGMLEVTVPVVVNLSKEMVGKPINVPLMVRYGVTEELELSLSHSTGLCLTGKDNGCAKVYNDVMIGASYSFMKDSELELAALVGLDIWHLSDPMMMAADVGVALKYNTGAIGIKAAPQVEIGLNKRDAGNVKQVIGLPVEVAFQASPELAPFLQTGIAGPTDGFADSYIVPLGIGANYLLSHGLDLGAIFTLPMVATGMSGNKAFDSRTLTIYAAWRNL